MDYLLISACFKIFSSILKCDHSELARIMDYFSFKILPPKYDFSPYPLTLKLPFFMRKLNRSMWKKFSNGERSQPHGAEFFEGVIGLENYKEELISLQKLSLHSVFVMPLFFLFFVNSSIFIGIKAKFIKVHSKAIFFY